ncbi:MAG: serine/threonine-protein kinase [Minicystis sp.]
MNRQVSPALASVFASRFANWKPLGEGGEGAVFAVWDRNRKSDVALKVMRDTGEADLGERFEREYGILAASRSNHLVTVHDYGQEQVPAATGDSVVHYWYTMERCESSVRSVYRGMPLHERVGVALSVLDGLAFLHAKGIAHRDIKPDNVFLVKGQAKLGDFGLARASQAAGGANGRGLLMGSPPYLAPERWSGEPIGDERPSDQYAAGVMI